MERDTAETREREQQAVLNLPRPPHTNTRDLRLDLLRGLALYMILFDHVTGDPLSRFTYHMFGFSDAAEIFIFVSGVTCGMVYNRLLNKSGWPKLLSRVAKRASRIYIYYALSSVASVLIVTLSDANFFTPEFNAAMAAHPIRTIWLMLGLVRVPQSSQPEVFLLYIFLTSMAMPLFFWGARRNVGAALCVSGSIWLVVQLFPQFGAVLTERTGFNPLAWQFLFVIGLFFGMTSSSLVERPFFKRHEWLIAAAWTVVGLSLFYRLLGHFATDGLDLGWLRIPHSSLYLPFSTWLNMKITASPVRLVHFLSVALLFATYVRPDSSILQTFIAKPFIMAGRWSLEMFALTVVLSTAASVIVLINDVSEPIRLALDGALLSTMVLTPIILTRLFNTKRNARISNDSLRASV